MKPEERLLELRKHHIRLSRKEMAERSDIKEYKLRDVEIGKLNLSIDVVDKIVHTFNVNANWLLFGEGEVFLKNEDVEKKIINSENAMININTNNNGKINNTNNNKSNNYDMKNHNDSRVKELINIYQSLPPIEQEKAYHRLKLQALEMQH